MQAAHVRYPFWRQVRSANDRPRSSRPLAGGRVGEHRPHPARFLPCTAGAATTSNPEAAFPERLRELAVRGTLGRRPARRPAARDAPLRLRGSEGAQPPASLRRGPAKRGPKGVCWLDHRSVAQARPAAARETLPRAARDGGCRAVAGKPPVVAGLYGRRGRVRSPWRGRRFLPSGRFRPLPATPREGAIVDLGRFYGP